MNKRSKILLGLLALLLIVFVGVLLWQGGSDSSTEGISESPLETSLSARLDELESIDFSLEVLDSPEFRNFRQYGDIPVQPSSLGRSNPFASF